MSGRTEDRPAVSGIMLAVHRTSTNVVVRAVRFNFQPLAQECLELAQVACALVNHTTTLGHRVTVQRSKRSAVDYMPHV